MSCSDFQSTSSNCVFFLAGDTHLVIQFPLNSLESTCPVVEGIQSCTCVSARVAQLAKMTERSHCVMEVLTWKEQQQHHSGTIHNTNWASVISVCLLRRALLQRWRSTCKLSRWQLTEENDVGDTALKWQQQGYSSAKAVTSKEINEGALDCVVEDMLPVSTVHAIR